MVVIYLGSLALVAMACPSTSSLDDQERPHVSSPSRVWLSDFARALAIILCIVPSCDVPVSTYDRTCSIDRTSFDRERPSTTQNDKATHSTYDQPAHMSSQVRVCGSKLIKVYLWLTGEASPASTSVTRKIENQHDQPLADQPVRMTSESLIGHSIMPLGLSAILARACSCFYHRGKLTDHVESLLASTSSF